MKELFIEKTGGAIDVFLSSDGQSIQLGRNWVHRIQEALDDAKLMVVFVTPNALRSNWTFFESGFAYAKRIRVVPVGFLGQDLTILPPPLALLQGFNIFSQDGLDNLIALVNEEFGHKHSAIFSQAEYQELIAQSGALSTAVFGEYSQLINNLTIRLNETELVVPPTEALAKIEAMIAEKDIPFQTEAYQLHFNGVSIYGSRSGSQKNPDWLNVEADPTIAAITLPIIEELLSAIRTDGIRGVTITLAFVGLVASLFEQHKKTARLYGSDVTLGKGGSLAFRDLEFTIDHGHGYLVGETYQRGETLVKLSVNAEALPLSEIGDLLTLLFDRNVLFIEQA